LDPIELGAHGEINIQQAQGDLVGVGEPMMKDDFIQQNDIIYMNLKHKEGSWSLHANPAISIQTWANSH